MRPLVLVLAAVGSLPAQESRPGQEVPARSESRPSVERDVADLADAKLREAALESLTQRLDEASELLTKALDSHDPCLRATVLQLWRRAPEKAPARRVVALLRDEDGDVREQAVLLYAAARPENWEADLMRILPRESDTRVKRQIVVSLGDSGNVACVPSLVDFLETAADEYLQKRAAAALLSLTQKRLGKDVPAWRAWWRGGDRIAEAKAKAAPPPPK